MEQVPLDFLGELRRTHDCGALRAADAGQRAILMGWVHRRRDLGGVLFIHLRDREGVTQLVFRSDGDPAVHAKAELLGSDYVIAVEGLVERRAADTVNTSIETGDVEVVVEKIWILNESKTPPFPMEENVDVSEDARLKYRYVDLRRPHMQRNIILRSEISFATRQFLTSQGFLEIETPFMTRSTPEGARDYLVPSRVQPGNFYALPQSPQIFKQLLMISGFEKYFQIVRCFRDEDLRADRQYEFTQIDLEMSFPTEEDVFDAVEAFLAEGFSAAGIEASRPFRRLTYAEAMERYGTDRPDLRYDLPLADFSALCAGSGFGPFEKALSSGGAVRGLRVPGGAASSRKKLDEMAELAREHGAGGIVWVKREAALSSPAAKHLPEGMLERLAAAAGLETGDLLVLVADKPKAVFAALAALRAAAARDGGLVDPARYVFCWVTDFPLFGYDDESKTWFPMNHPFTAPSEEDLPRLESDPGTV